MATDRKALEDALLPCPFCGGDAEMDTQQGYEYSKAGVHRIGRRVTIYCRECPTDLGICHEDVPDYSTDDLVSQVTERWNKRAQLAAISTAPLGAQQEQHDDNDGEGSDRGQQGVRSVCVERPGQATERSEYSATGQFRDNGNPRRTVCGGEGNRRLRQLAVVGDGGLADEFANMARSPTFFAEYGAKWMLDNKVRILAALRANSGAVVAREPELTNDMRGACANVFMGGRRDGESWPQFAERAWIAMQQASDSGAVVEIPREPTSAMFQAMQDAFTSLDDWSFPDLWRAGWDAATKASRAEGEG